MNNLTPNDFFNIRGLAFKELFIQQKAVWDILKTVSGFLETKISGKKIAKQVKIHSAVAISGKNILIDSGVVIEPFVTLDASTGPIWLGEKTKILAGAHLRGPLVIGRNCQAGGEIKNSIILDGAHSDHLPNYIGDSIVGRNCRLGCGTVLSNRRFDRAEIKIRIGGRIFTTGLDRLGAILGDDVKTGCNSVIGPGALIGPNTWIGQQAQIRNEYIKKNCLVKLGQKKTIIRKK